MQDALAGHSYCATLMKRQRVAKYVSQGHVTSPPDANVRVDDTTYSDHGSGYHLVVLLGIALLGYELQSDRIAVILSLLLCLHLLEPSER